MPRILVTGGAGFLGSHLCERLVADGHAVICLDDLSTGRRENLVAEVTFLEQDVCEPLALEAVDRILHFACPASPVQYQKNPVKTIRTCVQGTLAVLELARRTGARVVLASTSEVYGDPLVHPQLEGYWGNVNPIGPRACYDEGKRCAEALATAYQLQHGVDVRIARIFNTYGPRMAEDDGRVISNFIVQALRGAPLTIFGDGSQTRSFCYVLDLVEGIVRLADRDERGPVNLGSPVEHTILELAQRIRALAGGTSEIVHRPLPVDDPTRRCPDIRRAIETLGWRPTVELDDGLRRTVDYFRGA